LVFIRGPSFRPRLRLVRNRRKWQALNSTWTRNERIRQVLEGRRHLGQQVMEVVFLSGEQIPAADAESRFGHLVRDVVLVNPGPSDPPTNDQ
jgi:hypothetical protein